MYAARNESEKWARLITRRMPQLSVTPTAMMLYSPPIRMPDDSD
jgi:hypothetical protein